MELFESSSNWIIALGKTLVHSLWIGILCLSILKILFVFMTSRFAIHRYHTALVFLLLFSVTIVALFFWLYSPVQGDVVFIGAVTSGTISLGHGMMDVSGWTKTVCYYCTLVYFTGIVFYLVHMILAIGHIHWIRNSGKPVQGVWLRRFNVLKKRAGIGFRTMLLVSDRTNTPVIAGFIKPAVLVPAGMLTQLPFSQVEAILMHELYHIKRFDHLLNLFQRILEILFFYHPAIRSISRIIRIERENCCDDLVLRDCPLPLDYARALYQLAQEQGRSANLLPAATGNNKAELKNRIQRILNPTTMKTNTRERLSALILLVGGILIVAVFSGFSSGRFITTNQQALEEVILPDTKPSSVPEVQEQPSPSPLPAPPDTIPASEKSSYDGEGIDWEEIEREIKITKQKAMEEIDWEQIKKDMEQARQQVIEEIDWEQIKEDMEEAMEEIDWEQIKEDMEQAKQAIDWEEIEKNMKEVRIQMDSIVHNFDFHMDLDFEEEIQKE